LRGAQRIDHNPNVLLILFAIFVFAVVAYLLWDRMRREPAGAPRRLWLASVIAFSAALACNTVEMSTLARVAMWLVVLALVGAAARARERATGHS
jgi:cytochrome c biogenesis factor